MIILSIILALLAVGSFVTAVYRGSKPFIFAGLAFLVLTWISTAIVTINVGQVGVVTRLGAITGRELSPGVSVKAPFPIEQVVTFDTRVQKDEVAATAASKDLQDVQSTLAVNYHLEPGQVSAIYQSVGVDFNGKVLAPAIQESFKSTTARFTAEELITKRSEVAQAARTTLAERVKQYGITIDSMNIVNFTFSEAFSQAIEQSQVAAQQVVKAQNEVERVRKEAEAAVEKARGEAAAQREQAQSITPEYLELKRIEAQQQWISKWNGATPSTIAGDNTLFSLPVGR